MITKNNGTKNSKEADNYLKTEKSETGNTACKYRVMISCFFHELEC